LALAGKRFRGNGFYILDEPEGPLSPSGELSMLAFMFDLVERRHSQLLVATHSPILLAYPEAKIYQLSTDEPVRVIAYEDTEHYRITRDFLNSPQLYFRRLGFK
jgi:predicted ATPase